MECSSNTIIHSKSCDKDDKTKIEEKLLLQNETSTDLQESPLPQNESYLEIFPEKSELIVCEVKPEPWLLNNTADDVKSEMQEPPISDFEPCMNAVFIKSEADIKMGIKEEPVWHATSSAEVSGRSTDIGSENEDKESALPIDGSEVGVEVLASTESGSCAEVLYPFGISELQNHGDDSLSAQSSTSAPMDTSNTFEESFTFVSHLEEHNLAHKECKCRDCDKNNTHSGVLPNQRRQHRCDICGKNFSNLKRHLLVHGDEAQFKCELCGKSFKQSHTLKTHLLLHNDESNFKCEVCGKSFKMLKYLKNHVLIHDETGQFKCEICDKSFKQLAGLKAHVLVHDDKRQHKCEVCGKTFKLLQHLNTHLVVHDDKRQFKCEFCEKTFKRLVYLKAHLLLHDEKSQFSCGICAKTFTQLSNFKRHRVIHDNHRQHQCKVCGKSFKLAQHLKRHMLIHNDKQQH